MASSLPSWEDLPSLRTPTATATGLFLSCPEHGKDKDSLGEAVSKAGFEAAFWMIVMSQVGGVVLRSAVSQDTRGLAMLFPCLLEL